MSAPHNTAGTPRPQRFSQGKRPHFYDTPGMDETMSMILVLAQEMCVLRDRIDSIERVASKLGVELAQEVERLELDQPALDARELARQQVFERLYYLVRKDAHELKQADSKQRYDGVIDETAQA